MFTLRVKPRSVIIFLAIAAPLVLVFVFLFIMYAGKQIGKM